MKTFITISISILLVIGTLAVANPLNSSDISTTLNGNIFILKAAKKYKGADVEVVSANGTVVTSQRLLKRKLIIDFKNVQSGNYNIKVKKGTTLEEFKFTKK